MQRLSITLTPKFSLSQTAILGGVRGIGSIVELVFALAVVGAKTEYFSHSPAIVWTLHLLLVAVGRAGADLKLLEHTAAMEGASFRDICRQASHHAKRYAMFSMLVCAGVAVTICSYGNELTPIAAATVAAPCQKNNKTKQQKKNNEGNEHPPNEKQITQ